MQDPISPNRRLFKSFPTKDLRELRTMLTNRPAVSVEDILKFAKQQGKNKLWDELAESFMFEMKKMKSYNDRVKKVILDDM